MTLQSVDLSLIQQLYAAYATAADRGDGKGFADCFTADGEMDMGGARTAQGARALAEFAERIPVSAPGVRHVTTNVVIDVDGDSAMGHAYLMLVNSSAAPPAIMRTGMYEDHLVRSTFGWRFARRRFVPDGAGSI
jgi:hypothetical protein